MTLNLSESNKNSNYYLTQIDDVRVLSVANKTQVDDIQTNVDTLQTDMTAAKNQIASLITAGSAGESQIALDDVIDNTATNTSDISNMKTDITDLQEKTAFIESVTASTTTQSERTTYLNDQGDTIGFIGPDGDDLYIGCSTSKNLVINPDQGSITHLCENTFFGDENGPGRLILNNNGVDSGSITIDNEVQNHAFTDVDHTLLNNVTSEIANVQTQINTTNTNVSAVSANNVATQSQLDTVAANLVTAETFISGHTDDIADLNVLISANATNITNNDSDIAGLVTDIAAVNTRVDNIGTGAPNQTQIDSIQVTVDAHTADISDHATDIADNASLVATNSSRIDANETDIANINTDITAIKTKTDVILNVESTQTTQTLRTKYLDPTDSSISVGRIGSHTAGTQLNIEAFNNKPLVLYSDNYIDHWCADNYFGKTSDPGKLYIRGDGGRIYLNGETQSKAFTDADHDQIATNAGDISSLNSKTNFIESVDSTKTTQYLTTTYLNPSGGTCGNIGYKNNNLDLFCFNDMVLNPTGDIVLYGEEVRVGSSTAPGNIILRTVGGQSGSLTINDEVQNNAYTDADRTLLNKLKDINQVNFTSQSQSAHFNDDVMVYYDFSDQTNLGKDITGRGKHALNDYDVEHSDENVHSAYFKRIEHSSTDGQFVNNKFIDASPCIPNIKLQDYTISVNVKALLADSTVWSFTDNKSAQNNSYFNVYLGSSNISVIYRIGGTVQMKIVTPFPIDGNWHNIMFTNHHLGGNRLFIDGVGVADTEYVTGDEYTLCDLSFLDEVEDKLLLGATYIAQSNRGEVTRFPFEGYMSDFIIYNRKIMMHEVVMLASGVIGYDVIILVGQSNIVGEAYIEEGIDDDYSIHQNRVFQYDTKSNIDTINSPFDYTGSYSGMIPAVNRLRHPTAYFNDERKQGSWRTFINDYIRYSDIPFRKNIIMVPLGGGGTSFLNKWKPGLDNYEIAIRAMDQVWNKVYNPADSYKVTAMLFNMGEADISLQNMNFKADFMTTYNSFLTNLKGFNNNVPVCLTQISGEYEYIRYNDGDTIDVSMQQVVNQALIELADENDKFMLTKTQGLTYKTDKIHLDMPGYRKLGERYYDTYCKILGIPNKKPTLNLDNNVKDVVMHGDLLLKPKNELDQWSNLKLDCFASKEYTILASGALTDTITLKFVKLGPIVIVSMDTLLFTADADGAIDVPVGSIPENLVTNTSHKYTCDSHSINFLTNGDFTITNNDTVAGNMFEDGTLYTLQAFFCIYTTN